MLNTTTETMPPVLSDLLKYEINSAYSREDLPLTATAVVAGTVLGRVTATGLYKQHDPAVTDGAEIARAVALFPADANEKVTAIRRGAIVSRSLLVFKMVIGAPQLAAAILSLADAGIVTKGE